jgi:hypothetical protein
MRTRPAILLSGRILFAGLSLAPRASAQVYVDGRNTGEQISGYANRAVYTSARPAARGYRDAFGANPSSARQSASRPTASHYNGAAPVGVSHATRGRTYAALAAATPAAIGHVNSSVPSASAMTAHAAIPLAHNAMASHTQRVYQPRAGVITTHGAHVSHFSHVSHRSRRHYSDSWIDPWSMKRYSVGAPSWRYHRSRHSGAYFFHGPRYYYPRTFHRPICPPVIYHKPYSPFIHSGISVRIRF